MLSREVKLTLLPLLSGFSGIVCPFPFISSIVLCCMQDSRFNRSEAVDSVHMPLLQEHVLTSTPQSSTCIFHSISAAECSETLLLAQRQSNKLLMLGVTRQRPGN